MDTVKSALVEFKSHSASSYGGLFSAGVTTYPNPPRRTYARADLLELQLACQTVDLSPQQLDFIPSTLIKKTIRRKRGSRGGIRNRIRRRGSKLVARAARIVAAAPLEICEIEIECLSVRRPTNIVYDRETLLNIRTLQASNITGIRWHLDILRKHRILTDTVTLCPQLPGGGSSRDGVDVNKLNSFFQLLPSKKRYRSLRCSTTRLRNSFLPQAVRMLNAPASQIFSLDFIYYLFIIYLFIHHWDVCLFEMYV